jgi:hypothetical protein
MYGSPKVPSAPSDKENYRGRRENKQALPKLLEFVGWMAPRAHGVPAHLYPIFYSFLFPAVAATLSRKNEAVELDSELTF